MKLGPPSLAQPEADRRSLPPLCFRLALFIGRALARGDFA
jgi:hypothetical protein